jgi:hypothetical protein
MNQHTDLCSSNWKSANGACNCGAAPEALLTDERIKELAHEHGLIHGARIGIGCKHSDILAFSRAMLAQAAPVAAQPAPLGNLPPVIAAYRLVAVYAEALLGACMDADKNEELGNIDGSHLDALANALGKLADVEREGLDTLFAAQPAPMPVACNVELVDLCREMVKLHADRGTVLTVHMEEMERLLAALPLPAPQVAAVSPDVLKDAERYRFRHSSYVDPQGSEYGYVKVRWKHGQPEVVLWATDAEIDAAIAADRAAIQSTNTPEAGK